MLDILSYFHLDLNNLESLMYKKTKQAVKILSFYYIFQF